MLNKERLVNMKKAAEMELAGLRMLAEAQDLLKGGAMVVEGEPAPSEPVGSGMMLMLSDEHKEASMAILNKVASELDNSEDEEIKKQAAEIRDILSSVAKNSYVYEKDTIDIEPEIDKFFKDGVVEIPAGDKNKPFAKKLETDDTVEVANFVKNPSPYQKL